MVKLETQLYVWEIHIQSLVNASITSLLIHLLGIRVLHSHIRLGLKNPFLWGIAKVRSTVTDRQWRDNPKWEALSFNCAELNDLTKVCVRWATKHFTISCPVIVPRLITPTYQEERRIVCRELSSWSFIEPRSTRNNTWNDTIRVFLLVSVVSILEFVNTAYLCAISVSHHLLYI